MRSYSNWDGVWCNAGPAGLFRDWKRQSSLYAAILGARGTTALARQGHYMVESNVPS